MPKSISIPLYSIFFCLLMTVLVSSFGRADQTPVSRDAMWQKTVDLEQKVNDHISDFKAMKLPDRVGALESAVSEIKSQMSEATWMLRSLIAAVAIEMLKRIYAAASNGKGPKSQS